MKWGLGLALLLVAAAPAAAQEDRFCAALKRVIGEKDKDFMPLKSGPFNKRTKEWDTRVKLPDLQYCRIDTVSRNFNCWLTALSKQWTIEEGAKIKARIGTCLGAPSIPERIEESDETIRSVAVWQPDGGAVVEFVQRIGKQKPPKNSVFLYVY